jgi:hypothetical protein
MAKTIALAPQRRPSSKHAAAIVSNAMPPPPSSVGTNADSARSARSASIVSDGKRASRSTESALGAATSSAMCRIACRKAWSRSIEMLMRPVPPSAAR